MATKGSMATISGCAGNDHGTIDMYETTRIGTGDFRGSTKVNSIIVEFDAYPNTAAGSKAALAETGRRNATATFQIKGA